MHELAASQGLVNLVVQEAERLSAVRVLQVNVALGKLSCLMPEIVQDYYNLFAEDTIAQDAKLSVRRLDGAEFYLDSIEIEEPDPSGPGFFRSRSQPDFGRRILTIRS